MHVTYKLTWGEISQKKPTKLHDEGVGWGGKKIGIAYVRLSQPYYLHISVSDHTLTGRVLSLSLSLSRFYITHFDRDNLRERRLTEYGQPFVVGPKRSVAAHAAAASNSSVHFRQLGFISRDLRGTGEGEASS